MTPVAHCRPTLKGEFSRTVNLTCVHPGGLVTTSVRNNAHNHILAALQAAVEKVPFEVAGLDFDNGLSSSTTPSSPGPPTRAPSGT